MRTADCLQSVVAHKPLGDSSIYDHSFDGRKLKASAVWLGDARHLHIGAWAKRPLVA